MESRDDDRDESKTTKSKSTELVAGIAALEVDHSTHAADDEAARAIANAGKQTSGYADALDTSKIVFATFVSNGFHEFMLNWFEHTKRLGVDNVIVAALDEETEALCVANGIPYHSDKDLRYTFEVMATGGQPLHDPNAKVTMEGKAFQQIGALKAAFLLFLLNRGHRVLGVRRGHGLARRPAGVVRARRPADAHRRQRLHRLLIPRGGAAQSRVLGTGVQHRHSLASAHRADD